MKGNCIVPSGIRASVTDERNGICALACVGFVKPAMPYNRYFNKLEDFGKDLLIFLVLSMFRFLLAGFGPIFMMFQVSIP